jgi:hypothetical protein
LTDERFNAMVLTDPAKRLVNILHPLVENDTDE